MSLCAVSGNLNTILGQAVSSGSVQFQLVNFGKTIPLVTGTNIVAPQSATAPIRSDGSFSISIQGNDTISPANTYFAVTFSAPGVNLTVLYYVTGSSFDLNSATPVGNPSAPVFTNKPVLLNPTAPQEITSQPLTVDGSLTVNGNGDAGNVSIKSAGGDAIQYVTTEGDDSNDGLSWGTAKATIQAAINALPSVTYQSTTWNHAGTVYVGAGSFTVSSSISISSPYVRVQGRGATSTVLLYTGSTGACFEWTANPFNSGKPQTNAGGLFDLTIDGSGASAGTGGLHTYDIVGFKAHGLAIGSFYGSGSFGWHHDAVNQFAERFDVSMEISFCNTCWYITAQSGASGYPSATTFGYGKFRLWINTDANQTAISQTNGVIDASDIFVVINGSLSGDTGLSLGTDATWQFNNYSVWMEGVAYGLNLASGSVLQGIGSFQNNRATSDTISGTLQVFGYAQGTSLPLDVKSWHSFIAPAPQGNPIFQGDNKASGNYISILNNGTANPFGSSSMVIGLFMLGDSLGGGALFMHVGNGVTLIAQNGSAYTTSSGNAGTINVYDSGGSTVVIQNKSGGTVEFYAMAFRLA